MKRVLIAGGISIPLSIICSVINYKIGVPIYLNMLVGIVIYFLVYVLLPDKFNLRRRGKK